MATAPNRAQFTLADLTARGSLRVDPVIELAGVMGGDGDERVALVTPEYIVGTTNSQAWEGEGRRSGSDIFVRVNNGGNGYHTFFWGGTGDDELAPALVQSPARGYNSSGVMLVAGWTNSRDLPEGTFRLDGQPFRYGGGDSDGLIITVGNGG